MVPEGDVRTMEAEHTTSFERLWWRWCRFLVGVTAVWLLAIGWFSRPLPTWASGWNGWWTGDRSGRTEAPNFVEPRLGTGVEIRRVDGNEAIRTVS